MSSTAHTEDLGDVSEGECSPGEAPSSKTEKPRKRKKFLFDLVGPLVKVYDWPLTGMDHILNGAKPNLPGRAYLELNLVVSELLDPDPKGQGLLGPDLKGSFLPEKIYRKLSDAARTEIDPDRGGIGLSNVTNANKAFKTTGSKELGMDETILCSGGVDSARAYVVSDRFEGTAASVARATERYCETGRTDLLKLRCRDSQFRDSQSHCSASHPDSNHCGSKSAYSSKSAGPVAKTVGLNFENDQTNRSRNLVQTPPQGEGHRGPEGHAKGNRDVNGNGHNDEGHVPIESTSSTHSTQGHTQESGNKKSNGNKEAKGDREEEPGPTGARTGSKGGSEGQSPTKEWRNANAGAGKTSPIVETPCGNWGETPCGNSETPCGNSETPCGNAGGNAGSARTGRKRENRRQLDGLSEETIEELKAKTPKGPIPRIAVPTWFYQDLLDWSSALRFDPFMGICQNTLFSGNRDEVWHTDGDCRGIPIPHELVFGCFGLAPSTAYNRGLNADMLLELYREEAFPGFRWSGWHGAEGKARVVEVPGIPTPIIERAKKIILGPGDYDDWTYLIGGKSASNGDYTSGLRKDRKKAIQDQDPAIDPPPATRAIQKYLNGLPQQSFGTRGHGFLNPDKLNGAIDAVRGYLSDEERRDQERRKIFAMRMFPQPLYPACGRSPRLKADPHNQAMNLPSEIRRSIYTGRDYELDLSKAHLASCVPLAKREGLDVPTLKRYLDANLRDDTDLLKEGDLWLDLASYLDVKARWEARRKTVKTSYSLVYGREARDLWYQLLVEWGKLTGEWLETTEPFEGLKEHPLMDELLETRNKLKRIIKEQGGLEDANGRFIPLSAWDDAKKKENRWRGALAYVNSSYEQKLMAAAFEEAQKEINREARPRFRIWLYQADGFTVRVGSKASHSRQIKRLRNAVAEKADELGVPTELEVDYPLEVSIG